MGWKPEDFERANLVDLILACEGRQIDKDQEKEMLRVSIWYSMAPHVGKKFKFEDIQLPGDTPREVKMAVVRKLNREEVREKYKSSGVVISDEALDKMFK